MNENITLLKKLGLPENQLAELKEETKGDLKWHQFSKNRLALGEWLNDESIVTDAQEMLRFFQKPWKWDREFWCFQLTQLPDNQQESFSDFQEFIVTRCIEGATASTIVREWEDQLFESLTDMSTYEMMEGPTQEETSCGSAFIDGLREMMNDPDVNCIGSRRI